MTPKEAYEARRRPIREILARIRKEWEERNRQVVPSTSPNYRKKGPGRHHNDQRSPHGEKRLAVKVQFLSDLKANPVNRLTGEELYYLMRRGLKQREMEAAARKVIEARPA